MGTFSYFSLPITFIWCLLVVGWPWIEPPPDGGGPLFLILENTTLRRLPRDSALGPCLSFQFTLPSALPFCSGGIMFFKLPISSWPSIRVIAAPVTAPPSMLGTKFGLGCDCIYNEGKLSDKVRSRNNLPSCWACTVYRTS